MRNHNVPRSVAHPAAIISIVATMLAMGACSHGTPERPEHTTNDSPEPAASAPDTDATVLPAEAVSPATRQPQSAQRDAGRHPGRATTPKIDRERAAQSLAGDVSGPGVPRFPSEPVDRESYAHFDDNPVHVAAEKPVSTFSIDVDTGAYANVRRFLRAGRLPPRDAVRTEELVNYFRYDYRAPERADTPFSVVRELAPAPWNPDRLLLHIGLRGYQPPTLPAANLVFLVDVSGSMNSPDKLGLLKSSLKLLVNQLDADDSVALVVYAGASGVVLEPTPGDRRATIVAALERLQAGGSTNGGAGIRLAYAMAEQAFVEDGINRVILATDGDFNVGTTSVEMLKDLVAEKRERGIALTTLGFGTGNYNDHLMEQIADVGNGNYGYIDTLSEARKLLVDELSATTLTIASDVKVQIEFNPAVVAEYRLIGYENRNLRREDFNNDRVDAGEIGAGHSVTALYEITLADSDDRHTDPLRYGSRTSPERAYDDELAYLRMRYKAPGAEASRLLAWPVRLSERRANAEATSTDFRFAASVAAFGQRLRGGEWLGAYDLDDIARLAAGARGDDPFGYRGEFLDLVRLAESLSSTDRVARTGSR